MAADYTADQFEALPNPNGEDVIQEKKECIVKESKIGNGLLLIDKIKRIL